jgi:hypothetical protein
MLEDDLFGHLRRPRISRPLSRDLQPRLAAMAAHGLYVGTSSWKYPGWCGNSYDEQRYLTKGSFSETGKFNPECLSAECGAAPAWWVERRRWKQVP